MGKQALACLAKLEVTTHSSAQSGVGRRGIRNDTMDSSSTYGTDLIAVLPEQAFHSRHYAPIVNWLKVQPSRKKSTKTRPTPRINHITSTRGLQPTLLYSPDEGSVKNNQQELIR